MPVELIVVFLLILFNGFFALSEMAVMTSRKSRLRQKALTDRRAQAALSLAEAPDRFLSAIQVWISLLGILTGYFGGASLSRMFEPLLERVPPLTDYAEGLSVALSVGLILVVSVVLGELVPKRLATLRPEGVATYVAVPMRFLAGIAKPAVSFFSWSTGLLMRLLGAHRLGSGKISEEEIKLLVAESHEQGVIDDDERKMVNRVLTLGDRSVDSLMTPRNRIVWLDIESSWEETLALMRAQPHSKFPLCRGNEQDVIGITHVKSLIGITGVPDLVALAQQPLFVPDSAPALRLVERFRDVDAALALVVDEYGDIQGLVTLNDVFAAVVGRTAAQSEVRDDSVLLRDDGSWLIDASLGTDDLRELLGVGELPQEAEHEFRTAAGMLMTRFGRIPLAGEWFEWSAFRFEVVDLDGARIDKILISRLDTAVDEIRT